MQPSQSGDIYNVSKHMGDFVEDKLEKIGDYSMMGGLASYKSLIVDDKLGALAKKLYQNRKPLLLL